MQAQSIAVHQNLMEKCIWKQFCSLLRKQQQIKSSDLTWSVGVHGLCNCSASERISCVTDTGQRKKKKKKKPHLKEKNHHIPNSKKEVFLR